MKKILSMLLIAIMSISNFAGCAANREPSDSVNKQDTAKSQNSNEDITDSKPKEVSIDWFFNASGTKLPDDGYVVKKIKEDLNINFKHIKPKTNNYEESLNLVVASGDIPDIIMSYPTLTTRLVDDGVAIPVEQYMTEEYIPNVIRIQKNWDTAIKIMTRSDGHIYAVPNTNSQSQGVSMYIRYDWLENLGLEVPRDFDELRDVLTQFTHNDPDENGKDDTVGTMINETWSPRDWSVTWGAGMEKWYKDEDGKLSLGGLMSEHKEWLKYMNSLVESGALDKETLTTKFEQINEKIQAGKVGFFYNWNSYEYNKEIRKIQPDAQWAIMETVKGPVYEEGYVPGNDIIAEENVITKSAEEKLDRIWDLYNYLADDKTKEIGKYDFTGTYWPMKLGERGVNWDVVDGKLEVGYNNEKIREQNKTDNWTAVWRRVNNQFDFAHLESLPSDVLEQHKKYLALPTINEIPDDHSCKPINTEGLILSSESSDFMREFELLWSEMYGKAILGVEDIEQLFDEFIKECDSLGYQKVRDEITELAKNSGRIN